MSPYAGQDPLDDEDLVRALGAALFREEHLGHAARPEASDDLELRETRRDRGESTALAPQSTQSPDVSSPPREPTLLPPPTTV